MVSLNNPNESFSNDVVVANSTIIVAASSSNNTVTNSGVLWTSNVTALLFTESSSNARVTNSSTGYIRGDHYSAVSVKGNGATIDNAGEMIGADVGVDIDASGPSTVTVNNAFRGTIMGGEIGILFDAAAGSEINNDGIIYGGITGVELEDGSGLTNSGEVGGSFYGIECDGNTTVVNANFGGIWSTDTAIVVAGGTATITNNADCLITGSQASIVTEDTLATPGRIALTNLGKIDGKIDCNAIFGDVDDAVVNKGTIKGDVFLGFGDDVFTGAGGTSGKVFGEAGNDTLIGGSDNDYLDGGAGMDTIRGGLGKDQLFGGADRDLFDFDSIKESVKGSKRDVINDFKRGQDDIDLRGIDAKSGGGNQKFKFIGKQDFHNKKGELRYEDKGNKVIVQGDVNGDGKADFEILVKVGALNAGDFLL